MKRRLMLAMVAATTALAGCKDSTGDDGVGSGSLSFAYAGARSGSYGAEGEFEKLGPSTFAKKSFATGVSLSDANGNLVGIMAYAPVTESAPQPVASRANVLLLER